MRSDLKERYPFFPKDSKEGHDGKGNNFYSCMAYSQRYSSFSICIVLQYEQENGHFSLIMVNLILGEIYIVYQVGLETINKSSLIVIGVVVAAFMFFVYYKYDNEK